MIDPDAMDNLYNIAKRMVEYEPEATLWDLLRYKMLWENNVDIEEITRERDDKTGRIGEDVTFLR